MGAIPGDSNYGNEVIQRHIDELANRAEAAGGMIGALERNMQAIGAIVTALGLENDQDVQLGLSRLALPLAGIVDRASQMLESTMRAAGISTDILPSDTAAGSEPIALPIAAALPERIVPIIGKHEQLIPPELRHSRTGDEIKELLSARIYGIGKSEIDMFRPQLLTFKSIVKVSKEGLGLEVISGEGIANSTSALPVDAVRGINMYIRTHAAGFFDFKRSDVVDLVPNGSISRHIREANHALTKRLKVPAPFIWNGLEKSSARYRPSRNILFIANDVSID
jgi:hypothetical protein